LTWYESVLLGALQGLTEFLPVSSSGHLVLFPTLFGGEPPPLAFDIAVHLGTVLAALAYYRADVGRVLGGLGRTIVALVQRRARELLRQDDYARLGVLIAAGTLPTAAIAFAVRDFAERLVDIPSLAALGLLVTGIMLFVADRQERRRAAGGGVGGAHAGHAAIVGVAQGIAITPGISRSGSCIIAGLLCGFDRELAVQFAFLLMIPVVLGAGVLEARDLAGGGPEGLLLPCALGALVAAATGFAAIALTVRAARNRKLWAFGAYCVVLSLVGFALLWHAGGLAEGWF